MDQKRTEKIQIMFAEKELGAIDNWRYQQKIPTRAAAIRELINRGLKSQTIFGDPKHNASSKKYNVVE